MVAVDVCVLVMDVYGCAMRTPCPDRSGSTFEADFEYADLSPHERGSAFSASSEFYSGMLDRFVPSVHRRCLKRDCGHAGLIWLGPAAVQEKMGERMDRFWMAS